MSYKVSQYPSKFASRKSEVDKEIAKAFKVWADVTPLSFESKRDGRVHIDIRFVSGEHGDGDPFDGTRDKRDNQLHSIITNTKRFLNSLPAPISAHFLLTFLRDCMHLARRFSKAKTFAK